MSRKKYLATLDIETKDGLKGTIFAVGGFYMNIMRNSIYVVERDMNAFFEKIFLQMKGKKVLCFIQNEDFDIRFILKYCIEVMKINPKIIQSNSKILQVNIPDTQIVFRDSLQFLLCSQAKAEETFLGRKIKEDVDFVKILDMLQSKDSAMVEIAYKTLESRVRSDVKGLYEVIKTYQHLFKEDYGINMYSHVTLPSFSMAMFRQDIRTNMGLYLSTLNPYFDFSFSSGYQWKTKNHEDLYHWTRKSYFGGRNEIFDLNYVKDVYYYDFNSLYPSICITKPFPVPKKYFIMNYVDLDFFYKNVRENFLYIIEAEVEENLLYPILPTRDKNNSVKFLNGEKTGVWCSPQFERFLDFPENKLIKIIKIRVYTEQENYFKSYMKESFDKKKKYAREGNEAKVMIEKIKMNSLTGKPAQKIKKEQWVLFTEEYFEELQHKSLGFDIIEFSPDYRLIKMELESFKDFMIVEFTAFITSYAQTEIHKFFYDLKNEHIEFYYCDTDCVFTNKPLELNKRLSERIGENELQLKNELVPKGYEFIQEKGLYFNDETNDFMNVPKFDGAKFYLPKTYVLKNNGEFKIRAKGISTFMIYETLGIDLVKNTKTEKQFKEKLNSFEAIENLLFVTGVQMHRFLKYKSSLRQNKKIVSSALIKRKVRKIYDKRKIIDDFKTIPFTYKEMEDLEQVRTENLNMFLANDNMNYVITEQD